MKTSIIYSQELWSDDDYFKLSLDGKLLYMYLISSPDRGYLNVFKWVKRFACAYTGLNESQITVAIEALTDKGFVEVYEGYICLKKTHVAKIGGPYGAINTERQIRSLPEDIRLHFYPDNIIEIVPSEPKKHKTGPAPESIKQIIARQPEVLREALTNFVEDRKERKRPPTTRAVKGWITKLDKMYPNQIDKQAASLEQSIERGWMGLFEVKEDKQEERTFM